MYIFIIGPLQVLLASSVGPLQVLWNVLPFLLLMSKNSANRPGVFPPGISWPQYWAPYVVANHSNMPQLTLYGFPQSAPLDSTSMLLDSTILHLQRCETNSASWEFAAIETWGGGKSVAKKQHDTKQGTDP